jgi:formamidopyrimidine-DNA glycosylase
MPELPEVETIKHDLKSLILNKRIKDIKIFDKIFLKKPKTPSAWRKIIGSKIKGIERKGKILIISLTNGYKILIHLRLTGQILYGGNHEAKIKIFFSDGSHVSYLDRRRFGEWWLLKKEEQHPLVKELGIEPLDERFSLNYLNGLLRSKNQKIYNFLMDQKNIAGLGNIYTNEILYLAKIHPSRNTKKLKEEEIERLFYAIKEVINKALKARGSSIDTYLDPWGNPGKYTYQHLVYGKEGEFCPRCPNKIMRIKFGNRSVYFCPGCQR